ncbi:MAG: arsenate reductase family protein [Campylobacterota bacterium]|nr:arsenate reductase family protein [Campylobacterota bacterium]
MVKVYGIKNCDSVKKALKFFKTHNVSYELIDFKATPVDCATINQWLQSVDIKTLLNTRGTTYRTLGLKAMDLTDEDKAAWLCKENMLIKRPVVEYDENVIVAFNQSLYEGIFLP